MGSGVSVWASNPGCVNYGLSDFGQVTKPSCALEVTLVLDLEAWCEMGGDSQSN